METNIEMLKSMDESHFEGHFCFVEIFSILGRYGWYGICHLVLRGGAKCLVFHFLHLPSVTLTIVQSYRAHILFLLSCINCRFVSIVPGRMLAGYLYRVEYSFQ